jgi:hypothetical protein
MALMIGAVTCAGAARAQSPAAPPAAASAVPLQGEWRYNEGASTKPPEGFSGRAAGRGGGRGDGRRGPLGPTGRRGGGFNPRGGRGGDSPDGPRGAGSGGAAAARLQEVMQDINTPPARLTIVQTDSTVIITTDQGRTVRLAPNGKRIKDDNTGVTRKTVWEAGKLVTEIGGLSSGTVTQSYGLDPTTHQLHVVSTLPNRQNSKEPIVLDRVYDASN